MQFSTGRALYFYQWFCQYTRLSVANTDKDSYSASSLIFGMVTQSHPEILYCPITLKYVFSLSL